MALASDHAVLCVADQNLDEIRAVLDRYGIELDLVAPAANITGSFWGEPEAGIVRNCVYVRGDTPIHSVLHECAHIICMTADRRRLLHRDAGGDDLEESGVCYLQIVLADFIGDVGRDRLMRDMDTWGYSFRLGSTRKWFETDAEDARQWLETNSLLTFDGQPGWALRQ
jgi:hypothetical protein